MVGEWTRMVILTRTTARTFTTDCHRSSERQILRRNNRLAINPNARFSQWKRDNRGSLHPGLCVTACVSAIAIGFSCSESSGTECRRSACSMQPPG